MCFSPEGDLVGGLVVSAIGVDACLHLRGRPEYRMIATFPILLGLHQIVETFVWWQLQGHVARDVGVVAMWIYLLVAFVAFRRSCRSWSCARSHEGDVESSRRFSRWVWSRQPYCSSRC